MARTRRITPHLSAHLERIAWRIRGNKHLVLFLDFDGTLARIAPLPGGVRLEDRTEAQQFLDPFQGRRRAETSFDFFAVSYLTRICNQSA